MAFAVRVWGMEGKEGRAFEDVKHCEHLFGVSQGAMKMQDLSLSAFFANSLVSQPHSASFSRSSRALFYGM